MIDEEKRIWAFEKAQKTHAKGQWASPEELMESANKLASWLISGEIKPAPVVDNKLPSLKPDDGIESRPAVERFAHSKIGTEVP